MLITIYELIIFHAYEWIRYRYNKNTHPLVRQEVSHNTWKSRCKVKRKPTSKQYTNYDRNLIGICVSM